MFVDDDSEMQILVRINAAHNAATVSCSLFLFHAALLRLSMMD